MKNIIIFLITLSFFSAGLAGCDLLKTTKSAATQKPPAAAAAVKGTVVAKVNNISITLEDLNLEIDAYNAMVPADKPELKINSRDKKIDYLKNELMRRTMLYQMALDRGLDRNEDVTKALEKTKMDLLVVQLVRDETTKIDVTSKEIEDFYNKYKEQYKEPEERRIREIVVGTEQDAKSILIELLQGSDFATLAKDRSKAGNAKDGGDMGFVGKGKYFPQFDEVVFSENLEVGKTSNIFKGPEGYYIVKLEGKRGGKQKPLSELWEDIKRGLTFLKQQQKIDELIEKLSRQAKIEVYESQIK